MSNFKSLENIELDLNILNNNKLDDNSNVYDTPEGIQLKSFYTKSDIEDLKHTESLPGIDPFVRGPYPTYGHHEFKVHELVQRARSSQVITIGCCL